MQGKKFDQGKPDVSLVTKELIFAAAKALEFGAEKYGRDNYKLGMKWTKIYNALMRHMLAFNSKEDLDPESGLSHLYHAAANLNMLIYYYENKIGEDDR